jgi:hypothetical protein
MTEIDETMKAYRLHVWRDHLDRPCSVCGSVTYRSLNTQANGLRVCGQCARPDAPPHCPECGSRSLVLITPAIPGPDGWARRCKACGHRWDV